MTRRRNPALLEAAARLHRAGSIPPNTYVFDVRAMADNARLLADAGRQAGVAQYVMAKHFAHDPTLVGAVARHLPLAVAVDWMAAETLAAQGVALGHVGHLVQVPRGRVAAIARLAPEVWTVASPEQGAWVGEAARALDRTQGVLVRVAAPGANHPGQEGGLPPDAAADLADALARVPGLRVEGVTAFPCFVEGRGHRCQPGPNLLALLEAARRLRERGHDVRQVNAPGGNAAGMLAQLRRLGATHAEPGHALTGTTPGHLACEEGERPAAVYVTEVSHRLADGAVAVYGGGFYRRGRVRGALVGADPDRLLDSPLRPVRVPPSDAIDYGAVVEAPAASPGDTVLLAFRVQAFTARSHVAAVETGDPPRLVTLTRAGQVACAAPAGDRA